MKNILTSVAVLLDPGGPATEIRSKRVANPCHKDVCPTCLKKIACKTFKHSRKRVKLVKGSETFYQNQPQKDWFTEKRWDFWRPKLLNKTDCRTAKNSPRRARLIRSFDKLLNFDVSTKTTAKLLKSQLFQRFEKCFWGLCRPMLFNNVWNEHASNKLQRYLPSVDDYQKYSRALWSLFLLSKPYSQKYRDTRQW